MSPLSPSPTPARQTRRGKERCLRVRQVAADLFLAQGYDPVSLDDILALSGGSKTMLYSQFGGKEGLFLAVVIELCDAITSPLEELDLTGLSLEKGLEDLGRSLLRSLLSPRHLALYRLVIGLGGRFPAIGPVWYQHGPQRSQQIFAAFLSHHLPATNPDSDPESLSQAAALFHDMAVSDPLCRALCGLPYDADSHLTTAVGHFIAGWPSAL